MPTGKLLARNEGSATAPHPACKVTDGNIGRGINDPLSDSFVIPPGIPQTPRGLAIFFTQELRKHFGRTGKRWTSLFNYRAYLRPAKTLLGDVGFENSVKAIVHAVHVANHIPSFTFVLMCAERFQPCPETGLTS
jgi:hypothetical protein